MAPAPGELLFFDTFSHEMVELNLDLVQFPRPVFVEEVRVIPLGARVEANFPGGVRLGATNPTQFKLECFVNNLRNPGAATFETVGTLNFKHDHEIHLHMEKVIPTDGLVLRGMYNAITLAVYGTLSNSTAEQFALEAANAAAAASAATLAAEAAAAAAAVDSAMVENRPNALMNGKGGRRSSRSPGSSSDNGLGMRIQDSPSSKYSTPPPSGQENRHSPVLSHPERTVPLVKDDILDNVSDISDGDIPDLNDEEETMEPTDELETPSTDTVVPAVAETLVKTAPEEDVGGAIVPDDEFMEAISDDEAEWSDEDMTDYDFGDWDDPVKIHDCFSVELMENPSVSSIADSELEGLSLKVTELRQMVLDQKWIDHLETLVSTLERWKLRVELPDELLNPVFEIALDCISLDKAQSHSLPAATIRHLKSGLRFVKKLFTLSSRCFQVLVEEKNIHEHLQNILSSGNVSTSIKYRALDLMDATLDMAIREPQRTSLYEFCLNQCEHASLRLKPSYVRILKRYNLKESLQKLRILTTTMMSTGDKAICRVDDEVVSDLLQTIWKFFQELFLHRSRDPIQTMGYSGIIEDVPLDQIQLSCQSEQFLQCLLVLLSDPASSKLVLDYCFQILDQLVNSLPGLYYLSSEKQTVVQLTKLLLGGESNKEDGVPDESGLSDEAQMSVLGQKIACATYALQQSLKLVSNNDSRDILETIQNLHALTFSNEGQRALVRVLSFQENLQYVLVNLAQLQESEEDVEQGAIKGYAMDILILLFRYSDNIGSLRGITNNIDWITEEDWISEENYVNDIRTELSLWLKATKSALNSDFSTLSLSIEKNLENTNPIAIDLIQAVRALSMSAKHSGSEEDLKREENLLQMFTSGVCDHFLTILGNINNHHQQPDLQTATFLGPSGFLLVSMINNMMIILREILNIRIASHGPGFKDTSLILPLLRTYALLNVVPERALCKHLAIEASQFVIETLGIFTANLEDGDNSSVGTSIWTTLLKDLFSFSIQSANAFFPGLNMLSYLLPCAFPLISKHCPTRDIVGQDKLESAKKIWSVHLLLAESDFMSWAKHMMMCYQMVSEKLSEVLGQLIDLSPAIGQLLASAFVELVLELVEDREWSVLSIVMALGARLSTVVKFKVALSRLLLEDKGKTLLERLKDLTLCKTLTLAVLTQYISMIRNLCDETFGFQPLSTTETRDEMFILLQASLPPQSVLLEFILYLWHLMATTAHVELHDPTLNTLKVICRHDFGFALVQHCLTKILVAPCLSLVKSVNGNEDLSRSKLSTLLEFLDFVSRVPIDENAKFSLPKRTKYFKDMHMRKLFGGTSSEVSDAIQKVKNDLKPPMDGDQNTEDSINDPSELLKRLDDLDQLVKSWGDGSDLNGEVDNPIANSDSNLPPLSDLFARATKQSVEGNVSGSNSIEKTPSSESVTETLDLIEVAEAALCKDFDLAEELKKVCYEKSLATNTDPKVVKKSEIERKALHNKSLISNFKTGGQISIRGRVYNRLGSRPDGFRSRPANTSRPPSLHVDDFLVLQQRGQQPTGPTGYNKQSLLAAKELFAEREAQHAKSSVPGFREATKEPVYDGGRPGGVGGGGGGVGRRGGGTGGRPNGPNGPGGRGPRPSRGWSPGEGGGGDRRQGRRGGGNWSGDRRSSLKERRKLGGRDDRNKIPPRSMNR